MLQKKKVLNQNQERTMNMAVDSTAAIQTDAAPQKNYYKGSTEVATETPLTLTRLETRRVLTTTSSRLVIVLVGLPARGKSFVARKMEHYLNWSGVLCKIFNVGRYRREAYASLQIETKTMEGDIVSSQEGVSGGACGADFFDAKNEMAARLREKVAETALKDMLRWLDEVDDEADVLNRESGDDSTHDFSTHGGTLNIKPKLQYRNNERIAIFDATNSTDKRRQWLLEQCTSPHLRQNKTTGIIFVESICDDKELLMENYRFKISNSPDFQGMSQEMAMEDLMKRVTKYEEQYETITQDALSYIKIYNLSTKLMCNHIYGRIAKDLVPALMAWHIGSRPIFLVRPGQTITGVTTDGEDYVNRSSVSKNDPQFLDLSIRARRRSMRGDTLGPAGVKFRNELLEFMFEEVQEFLLKRASVRDMGHTGTSYSGLGAGNWYYGGPEGSFDDTEDVDGQVESFCTLPEEEAPKHATSASTSFPLRVLTSTMPRALDTVVWNIHHQINVHQMSNLNPLDKGDFVGLEMEEIQEVNPSWFEQLETDPYGTRFPGGECYRDLIRRLTSVVIDIEQQVIPTLVVSHVSILQCLMAYFRNTRIENCMSIEVPMHTVIKFEPVRGGGFRETQHYLGESSGDVDASTVDAQVSLTRKHSETESNASGNKTGPIWSDNVASPVGTM